VISLNVGIERDRRAGKVELKMRVTALALWLRDAYIYFFIYQVLVLKYEESGVR
jgi:hypothetical protein